MFLPSTIIRGLGTQREFPRLGLVAMDVDVVVVLVFGSAVVAGAEVTSGPTIHAFNIDSTFTHLWTCRDKKFVQ